MSVILHEKDLPAQVPAEQAVEAAYAAELAETAETLARGVPVLIECEKDLTPYLFRQLRGRLRQAKLDCLYLDGRPLPEDPEVLPLGLMGTTLAQLRAAVRGPVGRRVVVLPHLDLLTGTAAGLTAEAREVIPLLYENPELVWLGFRDPSFPLPRVVEELFPRRLSAVGVARDRLRHLITKAESRKLGQPLRLAELYQHVSGLSALRLRKALTTLQGEDHPADARPAFAHLRRASLTGRLEVPPLDLERDVGGYDGVKRRLREEVLDVLARRNEAGSAGELEELEELIPKGIIFAGAATGKLLFARALAGSLGAGLLAASAAELKSRYFGASEENLRQLFARARQAAPAMIVFDELDSFAGPRRAVDRAAGVEASMLAQLLAEMDRLPRAEMVFVAGTTRSLDRLDPALLRPGRFELLLELPHPDADDRRAILELYDRKLRLRMTADAVACAVEGTAGEVPGGPPGTRYSGDHLHALCRALARLRARGRRDDATGPEDVRLALAVAFRPPASSPGAVGCEGTP
jgi:cell division protease FtsH